MIRKEHKNLIDSGATTAKCWQVGAEMFFGITSQRSANRAMRRGGKRFSITVERLVGDYSLGHPQ
jgi:hypothetical protein